MQYPAPTIKQEWLRMVESIFLYVIEKIYFTMFTFFMEDILWIGVHRSLMQLSIHKRLVLSEML